MSELGATPLVSRDLLTPSNTGCGHHVDSLNIQHVVEVGDVTNGEAQDLDLGQFFVRWDRRQQFSQLCKGHVESHHTDALPGGVRGSILGSRAPPPSLLLPAEGGHVHGLRRYGPALNAVQKGVRVRTYPEQLGMRLVRTEHRPPVLRLQIT